MKFILPYILVFIGCCSFAHAEENISQKINHAFKHYLDRSYERAFPVFLEAAESGHVLSQYMVMGMSYRGWGTTKNWQTANKWRVLASKGSEDAQKEAFEVFLKMAKNGDAMSQYLVAGMYLRGDGVKRNSKEAFNWGLKAAKQCDTAAQIGLSIGYSSRKENRIENLKQSHAWSGLAYLMGDHTAKHFMDYFENELDAISLHQANELKMNYYKEYCTPK